MKINHITIQDKPDHPGTLISWTEEGTLKRKTVCDMRAGAKYAIHLLADKNLNRPMHKIRISNLDMLLLSFK